MGHSGDDAVYKKKKKKTYVLSESAEKFGIGWFYSSK